VLESRVRRNIDSAWDLVWASGITNPLAVVDYITPILLLSRMADASRESSALSRLRDASACGDSAKSLEIVSDALRVFELVVVDVNAWRDTKLLSKVTELVARSVIGDRNFDMVGDCYEYVLSRLSTAGQFGQFRTPRHIIKFLVDVVQPRADEIVLDPACGTGGFLIAAHEHQPRARFRGDECDWTMFRIASANLILHGITDADVRRRDALSALVPEADVVLANPPFAGIVDETRRLQFDSGATKSELLFIELVLRRLKDGGRAGIVVPYGVLTNTSAAATAVRRMLVDQNRVRTVVELPGGVFRPYTDVKSALLILERAKPSQSILMVRARSDGFSLDDRRQSVPEDDLRTLLAFVTGSSLVGDLPAGLGREVGLWEIQDSAYSLSPSRYLETERAFSPTCTSLGEALGSTKDCAVRLADILQRIEAII
jgi:type I restriction enzyme M protein